MREEFQRKYDEIRSLSEADYSAMRRVLYTDVESLLYTGFLTTPVTVGGVPLVLRSLNPGDTFMIRARVGRALHTGIWQSWVIAQSTWMVDGYPTNNHPGMTERLFSSLCLLPTRARESLYVAVLGLSRRVSRALDKIEAYCYEPYSRSAWKMCGGKSPASQSYTGVDGTSLMGMNHAQQMWIAYNQAEDQREAYIRDWSVGKLMVSATSPKGVKKLNAEDDRIRQKENERRQTVIRGMVQRILYGKENKESSTISVMVEGQLVQVDRVTTAKSVDQLAEQYQRWVAGEKDFHDVVVETYKDRIRSTFEREKEERERLLERAQDPESDMPVPLVGYTRDQLQDIRPDLVDPQSHRTKVFDKDASRYLYNRNVAAQEAPGAISFGPDGPVAVQQDPHPREGSEGLQERVSHRAPAMRSEPIVPPSSDRGD